MAKKKKPLEEDLVEKEPELQEFSHFMQKSYVDYALSVILDRACPDVRDGLKPVQRRILFDMLDLGITSTKPYRKCARIVGDTMGRFHVHGDSSIYGALINMGIPWKNNACLSDIHGNAGSVDGDGPAAMRYTEARLSPLGELMLEGINPNIVPYRDTFDAEEQEPVVLPSKIPQLLINGCDGLAVGMKTYIPTHNLGELMDAAILLMQKPKSTTKDLMEFVQGPDYPTGGEIINKNELYNLYETGMGKVVIRGKSHIEELSGGRTNLVITEVPYTSSGNKTLLVSSIIAMIKENKLPEVADIRDESAEDIRIVLEIKKGQDVNKVLNKLYKKTKLQDNENCNFLVIVDGVTPKTIGLKEYLQYFISFQEEITTNKYKELLAKANNRLEIVEGLLIANDMVDPIIETIRYAKNVSTAKNCLMTGNTTDIAYKLKKNEALAKKFAFTENQAQVILDMRLAKLNNLEISAFEKEKAQLLKAIASYEKILNSKSLLDKEIIKYLTEIRNKFATPRKTSIVNGEVNVVVEDDIPVEEDVSILIDRFGYLKVVDTISVSRSSEDTLSSFKHNITAKNTDKLAVFTSSGNIYQIKLYDLPRLKIKDKGQPIDVLCGFKGKEDILLISPMNDIIPNKVIFIFNDGYVKMVKGEEYVTRQKQTVATKLYDNTIVNILLNTNETSLIATTDKKERVVDLTVQETHKKNVKVNKWIKVRPNEFVQKAVLK
jgi:DNA gyrase subunit A